MPHPPRPFVLHEASYRQVLQCRPNVAVLPWGATKAHNYHLPHGTDVIEATAVGEAAVEKAVEQGARVVLLPTVPFGNNNQQLGQACTITMRSTTQQMVLHDVAESLVRQGIDRLVVLNFHGGNEFQSMIRDVMLDLPIFIVQVHGYFTAKWEHLLDNTDGDHANEFETCLMLHLAPEWVDMSAAADGAFTRYQIKSLAQTPAVWCPRDWAALTPSTGTGDPRRATAEKGAKILDLLADALVPVLTELSAARLGDFPFVIRGGPPDAERSPAV